MTPQVGRHICRSRIAALVLLVLPLGLPPSTAAEDHVLGRPAGWGDGRPGLQLVWCDILKQTPFPFEEMAAEVERILGEWDVDVTWRLAGDDTRFESGEIPVILLDRARVDSARRGRVMGSTPRHSSVRAAWVFSSSVLWALGLKDKPFLSAEQEHDLARGLGRVVAHEIVHVVAPEIPHARSGLMRPSMGRLDLLRPGLTLESRHRRVFVAELTSLLGRPPGRGEPSAAFLASERSRVESVPSSFPSAERQR